MNNTNSISCRVQTMFSFLFFHLVFGYFVVDVEYWSLKTVCTGLLVVSVTACNYWLWLCPMNRVRDVRENDLTDKMIKFISYSAQRGWFPPSWLRQAEGSRCQQIQEIEEVGKNSTEFPQWLVRIAGE